MTTTAALAVSEAFDFEPETLPTCPDGSGDLWWDDASYARYQAFDPYCPPADLDMLRLTLPSRRSTLYFDSLVLVTPDYCDREPADSHPFVPDVDDADLPF